MPFNSFNFWLVFPFIFGLYWLIPVKYNQARKVFLILVSYLLYMNWKPAFALVLLGVTLITFWGGYLFDDQPDTKKENDLFGCLQFWRCCHYWFSSITIS